MTFNPNHIDPPEPGLHNCVTCEQCGEDMHVDDVVNVNGNEMFPIWICRDGSCLRHYATDVTGELQHLKHRSAMLIKKVTHGLHDGNHDFGRWDIFPDVDTPAGCLVFKSAPHTGQYRVIQIGGDE